MREIEENHNVNLLYFNLDDTPVIAVYAVNGTLGDFVGQVKKLEKGYEIFYLFGKEIPAILDVANNFDSCLEYIQNERQDN